MKVKLRRASTVRASNGASEQVSTRIGPTRDDFAEVQHSTRVIRDRHLLTRTIIEHERRCVVARSAFSGRNHLHAVGVQEVFQAGLCCLMCQWQTL